MCLGVYLLRFILYGSVWTWVPISRVRKIFNYNLCRHLLRPFSPSRTRPCDLNVGVFNVVPEVSETVLIYFDSFFFILLLNSSFSHSVVQLTYLFFCFSYSAISSFQCIFHFSSCVFHHCLLFSSSRSLLYISVFSRPVPPSSFWDLGSSLLSLLSEFFFRYIACFLFIYLVL